MLTLLLPASNIEDMLSSGLVLTLLDMWNSLAKTPKELSSFLVWYLVIQNVCSGVSPAGPVRELPLGPKTLNCDDVRDFKLLFKSFQNSKPARIKNPS